LAVVSCHTARHLTVVKKPSLEKAERVLTNAKDAVNLAPMLCILFLAVRMRALQIDPKNGNPQAWAQNCFYLCSAAVLAQVLFVLLQLGDKNTVIKEGANGEDEVVLGDKGLRTVTTVGRFLSLACIYVGALAVMVSVFRIQHPEGPAMTPPVAPALYCVIFLTCLYFIAYTFHYIANTLKQKEVNGARTADYIAEQGLDTVDFAPMLCMLFIAVRMRAMQLTKATDGTIPLDAGPQSWAQEAMFIASWSVLVALILNYITAYAHTQAEKSKNKKRGGYATIFDGFRYVTMLGIFGSAGILIYAIKDMTPEKLPPYASYKGLVPGVRVPPPPTPPPDAFF